MSYNNPHLLKLESGKKVLVNVNKVYGNRALAEWKGMRISVLTSRLTPLNPDHLLPYHD